MGVATQRLEARGRVGGGGGRRAGTVGGWGVGGCSVNAG